jgi:hypothetical protein
MANNQILFNFSAKFQQWELTKSPEFYLHFEHIKNFEQRNNLQIQFLNTAIDRLSMKYFVLTEDGNVKTMSNDQPIFKDGNQTEEYKKEFLELMSKEVKISFMGKIL